MANGGGGGVWVFYFMQGEEGDSVESPNVFNVKSAANEVRLGQFLQAFPLRGQGVYHFRFRAPDQLSGYCWLDLSDPSAVLPRYDNAICAKALRLDRLPTQRPSRLRRKTPYGAGKRAGPVGVGVGGGGVGEGGGVRGTVRDMEQGQPRPVKDFHGAAGQGQWQSSGHGQEQDRPTSPATHQHDSRPSVSQKKKTGLGGSNSSSSGSLNTAGGVDTSTKPASAGGGDLLNFDNMGGGEGGGGTGGGPTPRSASGAGSPTSWGMRPPSAASGSAAGVGAGGGSVTQSSAGEGAGAALGGFPSNGAGGVRSNGNNAWPQPRSSSGDASPDWLNVNPGGGGRGNGGSSKSDHVQSKIIEREIELEKRTKLALEFKWNIDKAALKDQDDLDAAKQKNDAMLTAWAEDHGKKRNIRTLLSTMHTVLWEGNNWKPVAMGDLLQPPKVKLSYRKAMLLVHPDKCCNLGPEARLIAKRVFEAVNEAYTIFSEKEMP